MKGFERLISNRTVGMAQIGINQQILQKVNELVIQLDDSIGAENEKEKKKPEAKKLMVMIETLYEIKR